MPAHPQSPCRPGAAERAVSAGMGRAVPAGDAGRGGRCGACPKKEFAAPASVT